jgi:hypothetical protein
VQGKKAPSLVLLESGFESLIPHAHAQANANGIEGDVQRLTGGQSVASF